MRPTTTFLLLTVLALAVVAVPAEDVSPVSTAAAEACEPTLDDPDVDCVERRARCLRWCM